MLLLCLSYKLVSYSTFKSSFQIFFFSISIVLLNENVGPKESFMNVKLIREKSWWFVPEFAKSFEQAMLIKNIQEETFWANEDGWWRLIIKYWYEAEKISHFDIEM